MCVHVCACCSPFNLLYLFTYAHSHVSAGINKCVTGVYWTLFSFPLFPGEDSCYLMAIPVLEYSCLSPGNRCLPFWHTECSLCQHTWHIRGIGYDKKEVYITSMMQHMSHCQDSQPQTHRQADKGQPAVSFISGKQVKWSLIQPDYSIFLFVKDPSKNGVTSGHHTHTL